MSLQVSRREAVKLFAAGAGALALTPARARGAEDAASLDVDPAPRHELSPYLFMQFMEPLGVTDSSVEAAWDHLENSWRDDVVEATRDLAPTMIRWGGIFTDFYRWREGVGPRDRRPTMINLMWGGLESNQIGTAEFVDFCRRASAEPLICVNFESDGRERFMRAGGQSRTGDAQEAAAWVRYCNDPSSAERRDHGHADPLRVTYWQLGNETSYDREGFDRREATRKTAEFAAQMRAADSTIKIIAWGDSGWARPMLDRAGEHVDMLAFHHMFNPDARDPVLQGELYRRDPEATWAQLMDAWKINDAKIREVRESLDGREFPLAMTECHFAIPGRNRCDVLSTWAAGVSYARILNNHQRHGDALKIATAADFCGTRWQVNALMIPVPRGRSYLMPVARVMKLYRRHIGRQSLRVAKAPPDLDVVASRTDETVFLHVVNTNQTRSVAARLRIGGASVRAARAFQIVDDPMVEVSDLNSTRVMQESTEKLESGEQWSFPAASVTAVEVELAA